MLGHAEFISTPHMQGSRPVGSRNKFGMTLRVNFSNMSWVARRSIGGQAFRCHTRCARRQHRVTDGQLGHCLELEYLELKNFQNLILPGYRRDTCCFEALLP